MRQQLLNMGIGAETINTLFRHHAQHPEAFRAWKAECEQRIKDGATRLSAKEIGEAARRNGGGSISLQNSFFAYYARIFAIKNPQFAHLFDFKQIKGLAEKQLPLKHWSENDKD